uniref:Uncharacterized protein n=1 Tax=Triticum urartu TaxID=4572 RepID=A0A8R7PSC3_TRIUA
MSSALSAARARCRCCRRRRRTTTTALHLRRPTPVCPTARHRQGDTSRSAARGREKGACTRRTPGSCRPARRPGMGAAPSTSRYVRLRRWRFYGPFGDRSAAVARPSSPLRVATEGRRRAGVPWISCVCIHLVIILTGHMFCSSCNASSFFFFCFSHFCCYRTFTCNKLVANQWN